MSSELSSEQTGAIFPAEHNAYASLVIERAASHLSGRVDRALGELGLKPRYHGAMVLLRDRGPQRQVDIADALGVDRTTTMKLVDALEALGAIVRARYPNDRRAHAVTLTEEGVALLKRADRLVREVEEELLGGLDAASRDAMLDALRTLLAVQEAPEQG